MRRALISAGILVTTAFTGLAQQQQQTRSAASASLDPCPGGTGTAILDLRHAYHRLDELVRASQEIVVGSVSASLPAFPTNANHPTTIETDSLISVVQRVVGTSNSTTITIWQLGGKAGPCGLIVPDDPLVAMGEQYVLFLAPDNRTQVANTSGFPRYGVLGVWSGKVKVVNGKIQFAKAAHTALHQTYDNMDLSTFIAEITKFYDLFHPLEGDRTSELR